MSPAPAAYSTQVPPSGIVHMRKQLKYCSYITRERDVANQDWILVLANSGSQVIWAPGRQSSIFFLVNSKKTNFKMSPFAVEPCDRHFALLHA